MDTQRLTPAQILELVPQQRPFRFVDEIIEVDEQRIVGRYTFRHDEFFYPGHFPGNPITPGVILLESMAQVGLALGIYLQVLEPSLEEANRMQMFFTDAQVDFFKTVTPGATVYIKAEKVFWRRRKLRFQAEMSFTDGTIVAKGVISGMGIPL